MGTVPPVGGGSREVAGPRSGLCGTVKRCMRKVIGVWGMLWDMSEIARKWARDRPFVTGYIIFACALVVGALVMEFVFGLSAVAGITAAMAVLAFALMLIVALPTISYKLFNRFKYRDREEKQYAQ